MNSTLGDRITLLRETLGLQQRELAEITGFKPSAISRFESDARKPTPANLSRLADALQTTTDYLLGRTVDALTRTPEISRLLSLYERLSIRNRETLLGLAEILAAKGK